MKKISMDNPTLSSDLQGELYTAYPVTHYAG